MKLPPGVSDNLRFLTAEVASQVSTLHAYLESSTLALAQRILDRSGYAVNLQRRIHESCLRRFSEGPEQEVETAMLRAAETVATKLERIAALCRECVRQLGHMRDHHCLRPREYGPLLEQVIEAIGRVDRAVATGDTHLALRIGRVERRLDKAYQGLLKTYSRNLGRKKLRDDLIPALFVARAVEQMGEALLAISEAIISANLGQPFDTGRYHSLKASVGQLSGNDPGLALNLALNLESVAETRSGSGISAITDADDERVAIFKDGLKRKVKEERQGVESWHEVYPGIAPRILSYHKQGRSAALLIEHLAGQTFEQILLQGSRKQLQEALGGLTRTLSSVWKETRTRKPVPARFMDQLAKRLKPVYELHPRFRQPASHIGGLELPAFDTLVRRAAELERKIEVPFAVYIHGDFNVDNIIYDAEERRINFVDLHRSQYMDYVQDVSVFMVSNYRMQVLDPPRRRRAMALILGFYRFAARFARKAGDDSFDLRLALGLARSFATSTRFILDPTLSRSLFLRARYLLELASQVNPKRPMSTKRFKLPMEDLFVG